MIDVLTLRFDAPLISFGGAAIDNYRITRRFPARSMLTGLLANALGWSHPDTDSLDALQRRLLYAVRCDRAGQEIRDFQTVDLSQDFLKQGWTTRGAPEGRGGGPAKTGTHIRYRDFLADAIYTVALTLVPPEPAPTAADLEAALREPARPLFIGRKCCIPSRPILLGRHQADSLLEALREAPLSPRANPGPGFRAWWPAEEADETGMLLPVCDERDWLNQIHVGRRWIREGEIDVHG